MTSPFKRIPPAPCGGQRDKSGHRQPVRKLLSQKPGKGPGFVECLLWARHNKIYDGGHRFLGPGLVSPRNQKNNHEYCLGNITLVAGSACFPFILYIVSSYAVYTIISPITQRRELRFREDKKLGQSHRTTRGQSQLQDVWTWQILLSYPPIGLKINTDSTLFR